MGEVAVKLFHEAPVTFGKELKRAGWYSKEHSTSPEVLRTVQALGIPQEGTNDVGCTLLPAETVEALMTDRRRAELVQPFRLALLKLASQEAARLMATGNYELALPVALDAVKQGQSLFRPTPALQLFPLYLLAAQANLGLKRAKQCEDFLGLASWLSLKEPQNTTNVMRSQLSRLFGQLFALQGKFYEALSAFAEDVYFCALEYGPEDVRTSLGYYNLSKVFQSIGEEDKCLACNKQVVDIWLSIMCAKKSPDSAVFCRHIEKVSTELPLGAGQLLEVVDMLNDIATFRADCLGVKHDSVADAKLASGLVLLYAGEVSRATPELQTAMTCLADSEKLGICQSALEDIADQAR
mmetsp:Transcript_16876/g.57648  ORF Transcript_16876/g.57648 Transcript_16876/m.57648 type:complete len:353 (+) Transcript_16876:279-1337(+)